MGTVPGVTRGKRTALFGAILAASLGAASAVYQQVEEARDRRRFGPPGRLVNINGRRLHLMEIGEGTPTVVIVPAVGDGVLLWLPIAQLLAAQTKVCVYDRAGIGWSAPPPRWRRRSVDDRADELRALLTAAGVEPPYILAGHSLGGVIARRFIARHPDGVCGLLLIDSSHEEQARRLRQAGWRQGWVANVYYAARRQVRVLGARRLAAELGLLRELDEEIASEAPPGLAGALRADILSTHRRRVAVRELLLLARPQGQPADLGSLPLTVLTRAERPGDRTWPVWVQLQRELVALSSVARQVKASRAGHYIQRDEPELVVEAIRNLVSRCSGERRSADD